LSKPKVLTQQRLKYGLKHSAKPFVLDKSLSKIWPHPLSIGGQRETTS